MPEGSACAGAFQMRLRSSCSSANTVVAPTSSSSTPATVATTPSFGLATLCSSPSIACAALSPTSPAICETIAPCAASWPKTRPATAITISSSGATENTV